MSRDTDRQNERLLNVARALRESEVPDAFTMKCFFRGDSADKLYGPNEYECGTPACALGHYAARRDLQKSFIQSESISGLPVIQTPGGYQVGFESHEVREHFGITFSEACDLFGPTGCDNAKTPKTAALFIERFVNKRLAKKFKGK